MVFFNLSNSIANSFNKYGIRNDTSSDLLNLDYFLCRGTNIGSIPEVRYPLIFTVVLTFNKRIIDMQMQRDLDVASKDMEEGKGHFHPHSILLGGDEVCSPLLLEEEYQ